MCRFREKRVLKDTVQPSNVHGKDLAFAFFFFANLSDFKERFDGITIAAAATAGDDCFGAICAKGGVGRDLVLQESELDEDETLE
mmetsp:Transcript_3699/g.5500  ORF Transcript_3699/g.5500 Transcript_3699/m.5500 type:complete len:85 (-) Transcript_3699:39-293(-)